MGVIFNKYVTIGFLWNIIDNLVFDDLLLF